MTGTMRMGILLNGPAVHREPMRGVHMGILLNGPAVHREPMKDVHMGILQTGPWHSENLCKLVCMRSEVSRRKRAGTKYRGSETGAEKGRKRNASGVLDFPKGAPRDLGYRSNREGSENDRKQSRETNKDVQRVKTKSARTCRG